MAFFKLTDAKSGPLHLGISSISLGRCTAGHTLQHRLDMAKKYGYEGIEMFIDDVEFVAKSVPDALAGEPLSTDLQLGRAASLIGNMCAERSLRVISLQPFRNYEGLLSRDSHQVRLEQLRLWCRLAGLLRTDLILIPSNFLPAERLSGDVDRLVTDLRLAAKLAADAHPPIRLCYEALAWGTHVDTWESSWELVRRAQCPNLGLCLDTFNIAGRVYADPTAETGTQHDAEAEMDLSLRRMAAAVDVEKIYLVQLADGEALTAPLVSGHPLYDAEMPARMSWSRNCRLFYGETGRRGYLPVRAIASCIFNTLGYTGWATFEIFHRDLSDSGENVSEELAKRGATSWARLTRDLKLNDGRSTQKAERACGTLKST